MEERTSAYWIRLQREPIDVQAADAYLRADEAGAVNLFLGTTRRWTADRETASLEYESYSSMALSEMKRLVETTLERWPVVRACVIHREGEVPLREASVLIGVATPHRGDAFAACRFLIDALKEEVPIWKRERFADGTTEWVDGAISQAARVEDRRQ